MLKNKNQLKILALGAALLLLGLGCQQPAVNGPVNEPLPPGIHPQSEINLPLKSAELLTPGFETQIINPTQSPDGNYTLKTSEGLELTLTPDGQAKRVAYQNNEIVLQNPAPVFFVHDAVTGNDQPLTGILSIENDHLAFLSNIRINLQLRAQLQAITDHITLLGRLRGVNNQDRAITFSFRLPFDFTDGTWWSDLAAGQKIVKDQTYFNETPLSKDLGYDVAVSNSPITAVTKGKIGLSMSVPISKPRVVRLKYSSDLGYRAEYDFGLAEETTAGLGLPPNTADFEIMLTHADPDLGLREVLPRYADIFNPDFRSYLSLDQWGTESPASEYRSVRNISDYLMGWQIAADSNEAADVSKAGLRSAKYILPTELPVGGSFTENAQLTPEQAKNFYTGVQNSDEVDPLSGLSYKDTFAPLANSLMQDPDGQSRFFGYQGQPQVTKFACCPPALLFSANADPNLPEPNLGTSVWNTDIAPILSDPNYSSIYNDRCDVSNHENINPFDYRRDHFKTATSPLTFEAGVNKPATLLPLSYVKFLQAERNSVKDAKTSLCSFHDGKMIWWYAPYTDEFTSELYGPMDPGDKPTLARNIALKNFFGLLRLNAYQKPIDVSIDSVPTTENPEGLDYETVFRQAAFYGILVGPGHEAAEQINKFRLQAVKYSPIVGQLQSLKWEPVTNASTGDADVWVERFGGRPRSPIFTVYNNSDQAKDVTLSLDLRKLSLNGEEKVNEMVNSLDLKNKLIQDSGVTTVRQLLFHLPANGLAVIQVR